MAIEAELREIIRATLIRQQEYLTETILKNFLRKIDLQKGLSKTELIDGLKAEFQALDRYGD